MTFQDLILKLQHFWASQGCLIQQPLDLEVGAGTSHPETLLRVLGSTPWNVAYIQPSRRPDDGRFGQNPNRLFKHRLQVILKPCLTKCSESISTAWKPLASTAAHDMSSRKTTAVATLARGASAGR